MELNQPLEEEFTYVGDGIAVPTGKTRPRREKPLINNKVPRTVTVSYVTEQQTFEGRVATLIYKITKAASDILDMEPGQIVIHVGVQSENVKIVVPKTH